MALNTANIVAYRQNVLEACFLPDTSREAASGLDMTEYGLCVFFLIRRISAAVYRPHPTGPGVMTFCRSCIPARHSQASGDTRPTARSVVLAHPRLQEPIAHTRPDN